MLVRNINFKNFQSLKNPNKVKKEFRLLLKSNLRLFESLKPNYQYSYNNKMIKELKKYKIMKIIGMGGSILGTKAIYYYLKKKINKKIVFIDNLKVDQNLIEHHKSQLNLIISKSGNTLETLSNVNIHVKKKHKNVFITERKKSFLTDLAKKLKAEIIEHKNFIGGRYSVLSEVGMLPSELMGFNEKKFKQFNNLIKNRNFINNLINDVTSTVHFVKNKKYTSVILNYDEESDNLFKWYQQLIAESLGKKSKGIFPIISTMPKDNHSLMQLYLDGPKKSFYTFFHVTDKNDVKIKNENILSSYNFLKDKTINKIIHSQKIATENIFKKKKIPFRSINVFHRDEESLGILFCYFILETILLGKALNVNPFDQPSVELIKNETRKILV